MPISGERRVRTLDEPAGLRPGDHLCWNFASDYEHRRVLTRFFTDGISAGDRLAYFAPRGREGQLLTYLEDAGIDAVGLVAAGALILAPAEDAYTPDGRFDADERIADYRTMVTDALAAGYPAFRVAGEAAWILNDPAFRQAWPAYEMRADLLSAELPFIALCAYDLRECDREAVRTMDAVHGQSLRRKGPRSLFNVHANTDRGLCIDGEVDLSCSATLQGLLTDAIDKIDVDHIDVSGLTFVDVDGARAIAEVGEAMRANRGSFEVRGASRSFRRLWDFITASQAAMN